MARQQGSARCLLLALLACACASPRQSSSAAPAPVASASASSSSRSSSAPSGPAVVLADAGKSQLVLYAPVRLQQAEAALDPDPKRRPRVRRTATEKLAFEEAKLLVASLHDLASYLSRMAGAEIPIVWADAPPAPASDKLPLLLGELAQQALGPPGIESPGKQGFRVVIRPGMLGLFGESDTATSYAIYELLDRLGCRWFMPGELGEEVPVAQRLALPQADDALAPDTLYRGIWYADADFKRRNRLGGVKLSAGHMLERWVSQAQRDEHPEWRAVVGGKVHQQRLRWSNPELAKAIATGIDEQLEKRPSDSVSLAPGDGVDFDESLDRAADAGDWDPTNNTVSLTDRLMLLTNRVATELHPRRPELLFGVLAYATYTRPPVRERVHPNVVPVIAPITYCRPHAWSDNACPGAKAARELVEGWSQRADKLAFRSYTYNLAEPAAPFPMLRKYSSDLPFLFAHKTRFFQPETLPNFETTLPGLYLGMRLSWNSRQSPDAVMTELFDGFYGHASKQARAYWDLFDRAWEETPEFSGGGLGHARRFPPQLLQRARQAMKKLVDACRTDRERRRVDMLDASLKQLELYMKMDASFKRGQLATLANDTSQWQAQAYRLADQYQANFAFAKAGWAQGSVYASYFKRFLEPLYLEADRIGRETALLSKRPFCSASYRLAPELKLPQAGAPAELDASDKTTDFCNETWSTLGQHDYFGAMWYGIDLELDEVPRGKSAYLWLSKLDGVVQVWLNGALVRPKGAAPSAPASAETHLRGMTYDISAVLRPKTVNRLTVVVQRTSLAELGAGGLIGPVYVYRQR